MRLLYTIFTLAVGGYGLYWLADKNPDMKQKAEEWLEFRTISALETRFDAPQIMEMHQKKLLSEKGSRFLDPEIKFFPFLLMETKYCDAKGRTKESLILWDLIDGEMILDTKYWKKTHGFADCILNTTQLQEWKILQTLVEQGGSCHFQILLDKLHLDMDKLEILLQSCLRKNLILQTENQKYRLHLENPLFTTIPLTKFHEQLTTREHKKAKKAQKHFAPAQIQRMAQMIFGEKFSIRKKTEVYLPVHRIIVQKPDGSIQTTHFNALTGKELPHVPF